MDLAKPEAISLGQIGANIGMVIGKSIEGKADMGLEMSKFGSGLNKST